MQKQHFMWGVIDLVRVNLEKLQGGQNYDLNAKINGMFRALGSG
jgi:hypothetical protein